MTQWKVRTDLREKQTGVKACLFLMYIFFNKGGEK